MLIHNDPALLPACADIYAAAYAEDPWNETFDRCELETCLRAYIERSGLHLFVWLHDGAPAGLALCSIIPAVGSDFARIEDFCITPALQKRGLGSRLMTELCRALRDMGCDSALLATQKGFPAQHFYEKNGFVPLDTSVQLYREF